MMFGLLFLLKCVLLEKYEGGREEFFNFTLLGLEIWRGGEMKETNSLPSNFLSPCNVGRCGSGWKVACTCELSSINFPRILFYLTLPPLIFIKL